MSGGKKILVVDDEPGALKLIGYVLHREGYQVVLARDGAEALRKVEEEEPDLVVLDVMMPDIDGYEVARRLRADRRTERLPILMLTAKSQLPDKISGFQSGADDYVVKPVMPAELTARVQALLARSTHIPMLREKARIVGFLGAKGGVGTTTLAVNTALVVSAKGHRTILADMVPQVGAVVWMLGLQPTGKVAALVKQGLGAFTPRAVDGCLLPRGDTLSVFPALYQPDEMNLSLSPEQAEALIKHLSTAAQYLWLDLGSVLSPTNQVLARICDQIVLVFEPNDLALRLAKTALGRLSQCGLQSGAISLVMVNRSQAATALTRSQIEETLEYELIGALTPAPELFLQAVREARPVVEGHPESTPSWSLRELAAKLMGQEQA